MQYPSEEDFRGFVKVIQKEEFTITKYLPAISDDWYISVAECIKYAESTNPYLNLDVVQEAARILYKIVKKHDLADSNKRSAVIGVFLFLLLNDHAVLDPERLKSEAKRIAKTKGRKNEDLIINRVTESLSEFVVHISIDD
ncbi:hypothetical protein KC851_01760 [Candidatus Kaiserbacteria bacterium]|nr:hypothetical protein [Candidatus Kaiserbacteria bacterium]